MFHRLSVPGSLSAGARLALGLVTGVALLGSVGGVAADRIVIAEAMVGDW